MICGKELFLLFGKERLIVKIEDPYKLERVYDEIFDWVNLKLEAEEIKVRMTLLNLKCLDVIS